MKVYKNYTQEQLDYQYNTRQQVPDFANYFYAWEEKSRETAFNHTVYKNLQYGAHPREQIDIYPSGKPVSKTIVFIHGGYWHLLDKSVFHFIASNFIKENITTVLVNYPLAPEVSISHIVASCSNALLWLKDNIEKYNGNSSDLHVIGHSAGGHLASMLLMNARLNFIRSIISLSGLFHLEPVSLSYINAAIKMNKETAIANSSAFLIPAFHCPVVLIVGKEESDEFRKQSEELLNAWRPANNQVQLIEVPKKNHSSILEVLEESGSPEFKIILQTFGVSKA